MRLSFRFRFIFFVVFAVFISSLSAYAADYEIDPAHTAVTFKVRHLLANVNGTFDKVEGTFSFVPSQPSEWKVEAKIKTDSINTRLEQRDNHLKSADFFDVVHYPEMTFKSTRVTDYHGNHAKLHGTLSLHGVQKQIVMNLEILGAEKDPWGNDLSGFSVTTMINRKDFGLLWNQFADSGKLLVGEEVQIVIDVEGKTIQSQAIAEQEASQPSAATLAEKPQAH